MRWKDTFGISHFGCLGRILWFAWNARMNLQMTSVWGDREIRNNLYIEVFIISMNFLLLKCFVLTCWLTLLFALSLIQQILSPATTVTVRTALQAGIGLHIWADCLLQWIQGKCYKNPASDQVSIIKWLQRILKTKQNWSSAGQRLSER